MSLYVYCPKLSDGAMALARALEASRLRRFDGINFWDKSHRYSLVPGDTVVCWGGTLPEMEGIRILNSADYPMDHMATLRHLGNSGCPVVRMTVNSRYPRYEQPGVYIGRLADARNGTDLLNPPSAPDYWVRKYTFVSEYRVHSFKGKSIKCLTKSVRPGFTLVDSQKDWKPESNLAHPWIRTFDCGWTTVETPSTSSLRKVAHMSITALGLDFGVVDVGLRADGGYRIFGVNLSPALDDGLLGTYVRHIYKWIDKAEVEEVEHDDAGPA